LEARELSEAALAVELAFRTGRTEELAPLIALLEQLLVPAIAAAGTLV